MYILRGFFFKEEIHDAHFTVCVGIFTKIFYHIVLEIKKKVYEFCVYQLSINALSQDGEYITNYHDYYCAILLDVFLNIIYM